MLNTFFFIPANNKKFIDKREVLPCNNVVFDFEDAVLDSDYEMCLNNIKEITIKDSYYARVRFYDSNSEKLNTRIFYDLLKLGFRNFLIPKFTQISQVQTISDYLNAINQNKEFLKFVLLVEHPRGLFSLVETIQSGLLPITALGLGSHDYCSVMGMKHTLNNLSFARNYVLNVAKAFNLQAIDIVSTNLSDTEGFMLECINAFEIGYDSKFLIHPKQLEIVNSIQYYTPDEVVEAEKVYSQILKIQNNEASVLNIDGKVYEKPHIQRILNIIKWRDSYGSK